MGDLVYSGPKGASIPVEYVANVIAQLMRAETGSVQLDAAVYNMLGCDLIASPTPGPCRRWPNGSVTRQRRVTTSIDAALALSARAFPNGWLDLTILNGSSRAAQCFEGNRGYHSPRHSVPAIAVCIAILKARTAGDEAGGGVNQALPTPPAEE